MSERKGRPWITYALGALCVAAVGGAYAAVGPASQTSAQSRTVTAQRGVVQLTVSGSGNIQAASELDLGFKTGGVVTRIYVHQGEHVTEGRLLAELDPESAEVALEQSRANLQAAQASLAQEEETDGEPSSTQGSSGAHAAAVATPSKSDGLSPATREANLASARAAVKSDRLTVEGDEQAVADTRLHAPQTGTIVSLSGEVGEAVTARGTTKATGSGMSASGGSGSGASTGASGASSGASGASTGGSSSGSGSGSSSSGGSSSSSTSTFAVLSDLSSMQLVVAIGESEIGSVKDGQPATVTIEALEGRKLAAHVVQVATLPTSSSGVVSYDVTFELDQETSGLKPGMSATAEVVVKQAEGVSVPTSAISEGTVTVVRNGRQVRQSVVTGLAGTSSTIIVSGVKAGESVVLPIARATTSTGGLGRFGARAGTGGGAGLGGGAAGFGGGGGAGIFFRGGGG